MKLDFERSFTKNEYKSLVNAISSRTDYRFCHGKHGDKMVVNIYGGNCDNNACFFFKKTRQTKGINLNL